MKKAFFSFLVVLWAIFLVALTIKLFSRSYTIVVYKRWTKSKFVEFMKESKVQQIDKNYQLPGKEKLHQPIDFRAPHPYTGFKTQPGAMIWKGYYTNGLGHRSPYLEAKQPGVIRIAIVGGSTAYDGTTNEDTIIARLARLIREQGFQVEYINAAIVSGISNQELSAVVHDLLDLQVDLLISFDGYNDINGPAYCNGRIGWPSFRWDVTRGTIPIAQTAPSYYPAVEPLGNNLKPKELAAIVRNYLNNIKKISLLSRTFHMEYIAALQPLKNFEPSVCSKQGVLPKTRFYCAVLPVFEKWDSEKRAGAFISLADYFKTDGSHFKDDVHIDDEGNELVAQRLLKTILERKLLEVKQEEIWEY